MTLNGRKMKEGVLGALALLCCLQSGVAQVGPLTYLPEEVVQWTDATDLFSAILRPVSQKSEPADVRCEFSETYHQYELDRIAGKFRALSDELQRVQKTFPKRQDSLVIDNVRMYRIHEKIGAIDGAFVSLLKKLSIPSDSFLDPMDLCIYVTKLLDGDNLKNKIDSVRDEIFNEYSSGVELGSAISLGFKENPKALCGKGYTPIEYVYSIYTEIISTEIKGFMALLFSYWHLHSFNGELDECTYKFKISPKEKVMALHEDFKRTIMRYTERFLEAMNDAAVDFRACDADSMLRGKTFIELEGAIQAVAMPQPTYGRCATTDTIGVDPDQYCSSYPYDYFCIHLPRACLGRIYNCKGWEDYLSVCMKNSSAARRYDWIHAKVLGSEGPCPPENYYHLDWPSDQNCFCTCIDNQPESLSTHIINLQPVEADIEENKVVTGVRITVYHRVLHLQIQQGKLLKHWQVENVAWKNVNDTSEEIFAHRVNKSISGKIPNLVENIDYRIIRKGEAFNVDDIRVPHHHIITGVKFHIGSDDHLQIAIITREFDPITGKLNISGRANIKSPEKRSRERIHINADKPLDLRSGMQEIKSQNESAYILFTESDWKADSGQTTLPLWDAAPVVSDPPSPLGGFGIFYKSQAHAAGFLSVKLFSVDYRAYMEESLNRLKNVTGNVSH